MSDERLPPAADRLPTLTEILELGPQGEDTLVLPGALCDAPPQPPPAASPALPPQEIDEDALVRQVLAELQPRIDALFEARLREALAPALGRAADGLIRDARTELAPALSTIVGDAVARAVAARGPAPTRESPRESPLGS